MLESIKNAIASAFVFGGIALILWFFVNGAAEMNLGNFNWGPIRTQMGSIPTWVTVGAIFGFLVGFKM